MIQLKSRFDHLGFLASNRIVVIVLEYIETCHKMVLTCIFSLKIRARRCTVMRKRTIPAKQPAGSQPDSGWLNLEALAEVEITSEDPEYPIENALVAGSSAGWRASQSGEQTIRLLFAEPQRLRRILIRFREPDVERTQQFVLRWSPDQGLTFNEILRQQWNFSPQGTHEETEDINVDLAGVTVLELAILPDIGNSNVRASLEELHLG
jgi:hypothetical protein